MISFDAEHGAVHYPPDRRFRVWIRPPIVLGTCAVIVFLIAAAWVEMAVAGLPHIPPVPQVYPNNFAGPHGFPLWVRYCHFFNFLFVMMLIRSGLSILVVLSKYRCPVFEASEVSGLINHPVVVEAVGKCESRAFCGICKRGGKVGFLTFPPRVFSTALAGWVAVAIKSIP